MFSKASVFRKLFFVVLLSVGFFFFFIGDTFAACVGTGSKWVVRPKDTVYKVGENLETTVQIQNTEAIKTVILNVNGWEYPCNVGISAITCPASDILVGTTMRISPVDGSANTYTVTSTIPMDVHYQYYNNISYSWTDSGGNSSGTCSLTGIFKIEQVSSCEGKTQWVVPLRGEDNPYKPGEILTVAVQAQDDIGVSDDIYFYIDGWSFKYKADDNDPVDLKVSGNAGDKVRVITVSTPIAKEHYDGPHNVSFSWKTQRSKETCIFGRTVFWISNPGVVAPPGVGTPANGGTPGGGTSFTGKAMPKTGVFDEANKTIVIGGALVILGLTWTIVFPIVKKSRQAYLAASSKVSKISNQISKDIEVAKKATAKKKVESRRRRFEKRI